VNVTVTDVSELRKELVVALSAEEVAQEEKGILNEFRKHAKVPGFRPGKAPVQIIRQRYKKEFAEELGNKVVARAFQDATKEKEFQVYNVVSVSGAENVVPGEEVTIDITLDVQPSFEVPNYDGLEATLPASEVTDADVDAAVENLRRQRAEFRQVERAVAAGDYVKLSYTGTVDGTPIAEIIPDVAANKPWTALENGWEEAGTDQAKEFGVPAIIDGVVGMAVGEEKTITTDFADDFKIEELRGKSATYQVTVHEVRERVLPELNEEFLKSLNLESEEDLKARILDDLESRQEQQRRESQRQQVVEKLLEQVDFPLPESGIQSETQNVMGRIMVENMQRGVPQEEFEKNKEALHAQSANIAQRDLKLQFILFKIAEKESIEVTQEDLHRGILGMARQRQQSPDELVKEMQKDRSQVQSLQRQLLLGKTLDFVVGKAKVTESPAVQESA